MFRLVAVVSFKLYGCELPEDGDRQKRVAAMLGEIHISTRCAFVCTEIL